MPANVFFSIVLGLGQTFILLLEETICRNIFPSSKKYLILVFLSGNIKFWRLKAKQLNKAIFYI